MESSPFIVESGYLEVHRTLQNFVLSEIRLEEHKFDKCGCKLLLSVLYNTGISIIICTYFVGMFNRVSSFVRRVNASKMTRENEIIECVTTKDHRH